MTARAGWLTVTAALVVSLPLIVVMILVSDDSGNRCASSGATLGQGLPGAGGVRLTGYNDKQLSIARMAVAVGEQRGAAPSVIKAALMAAATESNFRNYANDNPEFPAAHESLSFDHDKVGHDYDSVGPWQLRVSVWGGVGMATLMSPIYQANWFYDRAAAIPDADSMDPAELAQVIERSAPAAYAKDRAAAETMYATFKGAGASSPQAGTVPASRPGTSTDGGGECVPGGPSVPGDEFGRAVVAAGMRWVGYPYVWGGGTVNGPSGDDGDGNAGFDCSGLVLNAVFVASGGRITIGRTTGAQMTDPQGRDVPFDQKRPGDLILIGAGTPHHVAIYWGDLEGKPQILHAPDVGQTVKVAPLGVFSESMQVRRFGPAPDTGSSDITVGGAQTERSAP